MSITAPTPPNAPPAPPAPRPLWQAPVFVLGVAALLAVWFGRPLWPCGFGQNGCRDLGAARAQLSRPDGDAELALKLATRALEQAEADPEAAGEAAFLVGSAYVRLAETATAGAPAHWRKARQFLDQAEQAGVPEADRDTLVYRLGKASLALGDVPAAIRRLEEAVPRLTSRGEGYALLVRAYLSLPTPNVEKALEANKSLREVPTVEISDADLTAAQLQGGELLLRLGRSAEARKSLQLIGDQAPAAVLVQARLLTARGYQEEKQYSEATRLYHKVLADNRVSTPEPARVYYALGMCYYLQDQPKEAARHWEECRRLGVAPEAAAAGVRLAGIRAGDGDPKGATEALKGAVEKLRPGEAWSNTLVDRAAVVEAFELAMTAARQAGQAEVALELIDHYARLAPPLRVLTLRGEARAEGAKAKLTAPLALPGGEKEGLALYRQAGDAYGEAAALPGMKGKDAAELLWAGAGHYLSAREPKKAIEGLERLVTLDADNERLAEAWYRLGRLREEGDDNDGAAKAYRKCMEYNTRFEYLARHQLALGFLRAKKIDEAEAALIRNITNLRHDASHEALTLSLSVLVDMLYKKRDYRRVRQYLEDHLARLHEGPEATLARFQLADSYRQLASQQTFSQLLTDAMTPEKRQHHEKQHREWLQKAADEFASLDAYLETPGGKDHLTKERRTAVPFITAKCWFNLGQFEKALKVYEKLITRYPKQVECLEALGGAVSCHAALAQIDPKRIDQHQMNLVKQRLNDIQQLLPTMPDEVREPWEEWVRDATRPLTKLESAEKDEG